MARRTQRYTTEAIAVTFEPDLCIHSALCLRSLPGVFDVQRRRWIQPENGTPDEVARTVMQCPSGALQFERLDGGSNERPEFPPNAREVLNGPLYVRGDLEIRDAEGDVIRHTTRAALCRCGGSGNKPFCDNTHRTNGFRA